MQVWKFRITPGLNSIEMPTAARPRNAIEQHGDVVLYAEVDASSAPVARYFYAAMTGEEVEFGPSDSTYIATVRIPGNIVAHIYEVMAPEGAEFAPTAEKAEA